MGSFRKDAPGRIVRNTMQRDGAAMVALHKKQILVAAKSTAMKGVETEALQSRDMESPTAVTGRDTGNEAGRFFGH